MKKISTSILIFITVLASSPLLFISPQPAEALVSVSVTSTVLSGPVGQIVSNTRSAADNLQKLYEKEYVLDPEMRAANVETAKELSEEMMQYVTTGMNGSPAFVTNLQNFMQYTTEVTVREFTYGDELTSLGENLSFYTRKNLELYYNNQLLSYQPESSIKELTDDRSEEFFQGTYEEANYLDVWLEATLGDYNDPVSSYQQARGEMLARANSVQQTEMTQLEWSGGLHIPRYCEDIETSEGTTKRECVNTQPAVVLKEAVAYQLGVLPAEILVSGDEYNEEVEDSYAGLSNEVITTEGGALQYSGVSMDEVFAGNGSTLGLDLGGGSYGGGGTGGGSGGGYRPNPIEESLELEIEYASMQQTVLDAITEIESVLADSEDNYSGCFDLDLPSQFVEVQEITEQALADSLVIQEVLALLSDAYINAPSASDATGVMEQYLILREQDMFITEEENDTFEREFLNGDFADYINIFVGEIEDEIEDCSNDDAAAVMGTLNSSIFDGR